MAKNNVPSVTDQDTFQTWINKTNLLLSELGSSILTASSSGDVTVGNTVLSGTLDSININVSNSFRTKKLAAPNGSEDPIDVGSQILISTSEQVSAIYKNSLGPRTIYESNNRSWEIGLGGSTSSGSGSDFVINTPGTNPSLFRFDIDGTLKARKIEADTFDGEAASVLNGVYITGDQSLGGNKTFQEVLVLEKQATNGNHAVRADRTLSTNNGISGGGDMTTNRTLSLDGQALKFHELGSNGIIVKDGEDIKTVSLQASTGISISNNDGRSGNPSISIGQEVATTSDVAFNDITASGRINGDGAVPPGAIMMFGSPTPPSGWLECNGTVVPDEHVELVQFLTNAGYPFGRSEPGSNRPRLPDMRSEFARGWDNGRGIDSGRSFGSFQEDELRSHTHIVSRRADYSKQGNNSDDAPGFDGNLNSSATGGSETRPRNIALLYCIKY